MNENNEPVYPRGRGGAQPGGDGARRGRKHMGVATSDPDYLSGGRGTALHPLPGNAPHRGGAGGRSRPDYSTLLESPVRGKAIFTAQRQRRRRTGRLIAAAVLVAAALALCWHLFLH